MPEQGGAPLSELLGGASIEEHRGALSVPVRSVRSDSRLVEEGDVFFAIDGARRRGADFVPGALERGAAAVVLEGPLPGGDATFVETRVRAIAQTLVLQEEVTLRASFNAGALNYTSGSNRVTDRFFLGSSQLRGFEVGGVAGDPDRGGRRCLSRGVLLSPSSSAARRSRSIAAL